MERTPLLHRPFSSADPAAVEIGRRLENDQLHVSSDEEELTGRMFTFQISHFHAGGEQYGSTQGADFRAIVEEAVSAIENGVFPERIAQGSSGSYFVKNKEKVSLMHLSIDSLFRESLEYLNRRMRNPMGI